MHDRQAQLKTSDFDYELPAGLIAQTPVEPRDASRLLVLSRGRQLIEHRRFSEIGEFLRPGDLLVANESRVIPARLYGHRVPTGGQVEMLLLNKLDERSWEVLLKPGRRVRAGACVAIDAARPETADVSPPFPRLELAAEVVASTDAGGRIVRFSMPIEPLLERFGVVPLPPYIRRP
jgi:S-adenosylmethionine:tRNA ribosyltransferase-isomerase